jgi:hypothetical protein
MEKNKESERKRLINRTICPTGRANCNGAGWPANWIPTMDVKITNWRYRNPFVTKPPNSYRYIYFNRATFLFVPKQDFFCDWSGHSGDGRRYVISKWLWIGVWDVFILATVVLGRSLEWEEDKGVSQKSHPSSSVIIVAIERRVYRSRMITKWLAEPEIRTTKQKWSRKMKSKNTPV